MTPSASRPPDILQSCSLFVDSPGAATNGVDKERMVWKPCRFRPCGAPIAKPECVSGRNGGTHVGMLSDARVLSVMPFGHFPPCIYVHISIENPCATLPFSRVI